MLTVTCKKTNTLFEVLNVNEKITLKQIETGEVKEVSQSTLKRWYTKPQQVEQQQVEQQQVEEQQVEQQQVEENTNEYFIEKLKQFAMQNGCTLYNAPQTIVAFQFEGTQVAKIVGKKQPRLFLNAKKVSEQTLAELIDSKYKGRVLTHYTYINDYDVCTNAIIETINFQINKKCKKQNKTEKGAN